MPTFQDKTGRDWQVNIDAPKALTIRAECDPQFVLNDLQGGDGDNDPHDSTPHDSTWTRMQNDVVLLCRVIYLLCDEQRQQRDLSEAEFYAALGGEGVIDAATEALLEAIVNFTPLRKRKLLRAVVDKEAAVVERQVDLTLTKMDDPRLESRMVGQFERRLDKLLEDLTGPENATD